MDLQSFKISQTCSFSKENAFLSFLIKTDYKAVAVKGSKNKQDL